MRRAHDSRVSPSHRAASGRAHGSGPAPTRRHRRSIREIVACSRTSRWGAIDGMSPVYVERRSPVNRTLRPAWWVGNVSIPRSATSFAIRSCVGPIHCPPRSRWSPSESTEYVRPPTRSRASRTTAFTPAADSRRAAVSPASPAPTTHTSARLARAGASAIGGDDLDLVAVRVVQVERAHVLQHGMDAIAGGVARVLELGRGARRTAQAPPRTRSGGGGAPSSRRGRCRPGRGAGSAR